MTYARVKDGELLNLWLGDAPITDQSKLAPSKPRILPVERDGYDYDPSTQVRTGPEYVVEETRVVELYTVRDKTADEVAEMKAGKVAAIKAEAGRRILEIMPSHKQVNWLALKAEMDLVHGPDTAAWPDDVRQNVAGVLEQWGTIKAIRERSNEVEAALGALESASDVAAFDVVGWE